MYSHSDVPLASFSSFSEIEIITKWCLVSVLDFGENFQMQTARTVRVINDSGLCIIGWDTASPSSLCPDEVGTFNIYTLKWGTQPHPRPRYLNDADQDSRRSDLLGSIGSPILVEFSLKYGSVAELSPDTVYDDDFEILLGDHGYVVWCFNKS